MHWNFTDMEVKTGDLLISEPFLLDTNFYRTVIQVVEHGSEGSVGFVLNKKSGYVMSELFDDMECENEVFVGGPVAQNTLHFFHAMPQLEGCLEILPGVYWGGNFDLLKFYLNEKLVKMDEIVFFVGYSGWAAGQLEEEFSHKAWIMAKGKPEYIFSNDKQLWKNILMDKGGEYITLARAPKDPGLN